MSEGPVGPDGRARLRRSLLAIELFHARQPQVAAKVAERTEEILARFPPEERSLLLGDWPVCRMAIMAAAPEVIEAVLDALAEGFSPWLLEQARDRCIPKGSSSPTSSSPSSAGG